MFHMLSWFDLDPDVDLEDFRADYAVFVAEMQKIDLVESSGPLGQRQNDTPMDTDNERTQRFFVIMNFRDRKQVDDAYAYIEQYRKPGMKSHTCVYTKVRNAVFICWQDLP
ncbi:MAG: hypothetical protein R3245_02165 [Kiloniellales bacterium]|nr:hypothetical protein [Kiloniellales bacterium]